MDQALPAPVPARRPLESSICEGNLGEYPLFVLSTKEARPAGGVYRRELRLARDGSFGVEEERSVAIEATPEHGFPTVFAYRLLIAVMDGARQQGLTSPVVPINRHELAKRVGILRPNPEKYADIENALRSLCSTRVEYRHAWYDRALKGVREELIVPGLVHSFAFADERHARRDDPAVTPLSRSHVRLSEPLFQSLKGGYFFGVDLEYMNALKKSPLAVRLYGYLTKKNARAEYVESLALLAAKLNLKKRAPSAVCDVLAPALELLTRPTPTGPLSEPRRFLESWAFSSERGQLRVQFYRAESERRTGT